MRRSSSASAAIVPRAPAQRGREREVVRPKRQREDVLAVQATHLRVGEAGARARGRAFPRGRRPGSGRARPPPRDASPPRASRRRAAPRRPDLRARAPCAAHRSDERAGRCASRSKRATVCVPARLELDPLGRDAVLGKALERGTRLLDDEGALARGRAHAPDPVDVSRRRRARRTRARRGREAPAPRGIREARFAERDLRAHARSSPRAESRSSPGKRADENPRSEPNLGG